MWFPAWAWPHADVRARLGLVGLLMVFTVVAGVLAMHALSAGHSSHVVMPTGTHHGDAHVHTDDHHQTDTEPSGQAQSLQGAAATASGVLQSAAQHPSADAAQVVERGTGHELCPKWIPGHCPAVPMGTPSCEAVLSGAGVVLLLLMLSLLALATRGTTWVLALRPIPASGGPGRWRSWQYRLPVQGPSLQELCISRT